MVAATPYDALIGAARSLVNTEVLALYDKAPAEAVRAYLSANSGQLAAARAALAAGCRTPPPRYDASFFGEHVETMTPLRNLSQTFALELAQAAADGDFSAAAGIGVDLLNLANAMRRGGLVLDFLLAVAEVSIAVNLLRCIRGHESASDRAALIRQLLQAERDREPLPEIIARDRCLESAMKNQQEKLDLGQPPLRDVASPGLTEEQQRELRKGMQSFAAMSDEGRQSVYANQDLRTVALLRMLAVDLALRSWLAEKGAYPDSLASLGPAFADGVPVDPFTQKPFCYRRVSDSFVLYSPGPTGIDHGGSFGPWLMVQAGAADLSLDSNDANSGEA